MDDGAARSATQALIDAWQRAWADGNGNGIGELFTADGAFVNIVGVYAQGPKAIGDLHSHVLSTIFKGSRVTLEIRALRAIDDDVVIAILDGENTVPDGPAKGVIQTIATGVVVREGGQWKIAAFHNTRRDAPPASANAPIQEVFER